MPHYKVVYFNARGRAEIIRQVFALAGEDYEDYRLKDGEWAAEYKSRSPFGQAPFLEIDGKVELSQSLTIARYLAGKFGLAGKDELEQAHANMVVDCIEDFMKPLYAIYGTSNEEEKAAIKKKFVEEQIPEGLKKFENLLDANNSGFFVGDSITWCDLLFAIVLDAPKAFGAEYDFGKNPKTEAFKTRVESNPKIAEWLAKRPKTDF